MNRRRFLSASGSLLLARAALAEQSGKVHRIGWLGSTAPTDEVRRITTEPFLHGLRERGWQLGTNFTLEERFVFGKVELLPQYAAELVQTKVDMIVAPLPEAAIAAKKATATIPIVTVLVFDPVRYGLIASYARPGGNVTGLSYEAGETILGKQLDLLKQAVARLRRVAVLWNPGAPSQALWLEDMEPARKALALELVPVEARSEVDLEGAFQKMMAASAGALLVMPDPMLFFHRPRIAELALKHRLPSISNLLDYSRIGGLMDYFVDIADSYRRVVPYVDKILRGARPADLPVEQPTNFILTLNLRTAKQLGIAMPAALLARADRVIE
jgi:putative tryptophan/tyrosine transport system substrate-binding protein